MKNDMTLDLRKFRLIKLIADSADEHLVRQFENFIEQSSRNEKEDLLSTLNKPIKDKLDLKILMEEQNYVHPTQAELDNIIEEADIIESIEELIQMI